MKQKIISIIIIILTLSIAQSAYSQNKTIEERLTDLEKRVQALEAKLGISSTSNKSIQPSDDVIKTAIIEHLKNEVPHSWAGSLMGGTNGKVELIEIQQLGNYNEQAKYWPVKCRVKGTCDADFLTETKKMAFDKIGDFKIKQDDYGKWYADLETF
jgi:hypothetical protein